MVVVPREGKDLIQRFAEALRGQGTVAPPPNLDERLLAVLQRESDAEGAVVLSQVAELLRSPSPDIRRRFAARVALCMDLLRPVER